MSQVNKQNLKMSIYIANMTGYEQFIIKIPQLWKMLESGEKRKEINVGIVWIV